MVRKWGLSVNRTLFSLLPLDQRRLRFRADHACVRVPHDNIKSKQEPASRLALPVRREKYLRVGDATTVTFSTPRPCGSALLPTFLHALIVFT